jgi:hypothetical protein
MTPGGVVSARGRDQRAHPSQYNSQVPEQAGEALRFAVPDRSLASSVAHVLLHVYEKN